MDSSAWLLGRNVSAAERILTRLLGCWNKTDRLPRRNGLTASTAGTKSGKKDTMLAEGDEIYRGEHLPPQLLSGAYCRQRKTRLSLTKGSMLKRGTMLAEEQEQQLSGGEHLEMALVERNRSVSICRVGARGEADSVWAFHDGVSVGEWIQERGGRGRVGRQSSIVSTRPLSLEGIGLARPSSHFRCLGPYSNQLRPQQGTCRATNACRGPEDGRGPSWTIQSASGPPSMTLWRVACWTCPSSPGPPLRLALSGSSLLLWFQQDPLVPHRILGSAVVEVDVAGRAVDDEGGSVGGRRRRERVCALGDQAVSVAVREKRPLAERHRSRRRSRLGSYLRTRAASAPRICVRRPASRSACWSSWLELSRAHPQR